MYEMKRSKMPKCLRLESQRRVCFFDEATDQSPARDLLREEGGEKAKFFEKRS